MHRFESENVCIFILHEKVRIYIDKYLNELNIISLYVYIYIYIYICIYILILIYITLKNFLYSIFYNNNK